MQSDRLKCLNWEKLGQAQCDDLLRIFEDAENEISKIPKYCLYESKIKDGVYIIVLFNDVLYNLAEYIVAENAKIEQMLSKWAYQSDITFDQIVGRPDKRMDGAPVLLYCKEVQQYGAGIRDDMRVVGLAEPFMMAWTPDFMLSMLDNMAHECPHSY